MTQYAREMTDKICGILDAHSARNITTLDVAEATILAESFVLCSGTTAAHLKALSDYVEKALMEEGTALLRTDGYREGEWIVLDYGTVLVHLFREETRAFYNLERLWGVGDNEQTYQPKAQ